MPRLHPGFWFVLALVLISAPALAEIAIPGGAGSNPPYAQGSSGCVLAALEQAGALPPGSSQYSAGGAGGGIVGSGPVSGGGSTGDPWTDGDPPGNNWPWTWWDPNHWPFDWDETLPPLTPDGSGSTACFGPASMLSVRIDDPEDPYATPRTLQDLEGRVVATGSDLQVVMFWNNTTSVGGTVDLDDDGFFNVEDVPLVPGSNQLVVLAANELGDLAWDEVEVIRHDDYCDARQGNVTCTEFWCDGTWEQADIEPSYAPWLEAHPDGLGILYPMNGEFPPATDLPPPPDEPLDAALTYSVFQENGQNKLRFHAELRSFDSLATPFKLSEVAVEVTASGEDGETTFLLDPFCYDAADDFYDLNGLVFGYVDAIIPYDGSNSGAPNTVSAELVFVDDSGDPTDTIGQDISTFIPADNPIAITDPVPNGLVAQINNSGLNVVDGLFASQVSTLVKDGLANPPPHDQVVIHTLGVGSVGFKLEESNTGFDGEYGTFVPTVSLQNLFGLFTVKGIGCDILFEVSSATVSTHFDQVPASDPHQVDLAPKAYSNSIADDLDTEEDWTIGCLFVDGDDAATQVIEGILDAIRKEIEPAMEDGLNGLGLGQLVGDLLQVDFDGTFSSIDDHSGLARYNVDSHFQSMTGNQLVTQSFAPADDFVPFNSSAPGVGNFDLGVYLTPAGLNQLLAARTNDGLLASQITESAPGTPMTVADLDLFVEFPTGSALTDPIVLEITPTLAPMTNGQPGPNGEMYQLDLRQLEVKILWTDGQGVEVEVLRVSIDLLLGLDISFAGPGSPPATDLNLVSAFTEILYNPYGSIETLVQLGVGFLLAGSFGDLVGNLFGDGGGSIGFLGLDVNGEGALRAGDAMALLFDLQIAPTQANISFDQDDIEDISVGFTVTSPFDGVSFAWDFGDGDTQTTTGTSVTHIFGGIPGGPDALPPGLHDFGVTVDVTRSNGAVVSGSTAILICIKENPDDICEM